MEWKLHRQKFGIEEFTLPNSEEVTIGRGNDNTIILTSLVVSRNHCVIKVNNDEVTIEDLKSSNGVYIGLKRISPNIPYSITENDIIGIGWTEGTQLTNINDTEKYIFKLQQIQKKVPIINRIQYQEENSKPPLKRRYSVLPMVEIIKTEKPINEDNRTSKENDVVFILSDSDVDCEGPSTKKIKKLDTIKQELQPEDIKLENDEIQFDAFSIKQEQLGDIEEPIPVDSESDSESEHWYLRLSQSSPGKPFINLQKQRKTPNRERCSDENSYSQFDDVQLIDDDSDIYFEDLISLVPPTVDSQVAETTQDVGKVLGKAVDKIDTKKVGPDKLIKNKSETNLPPLPSCDHTDSTLTKDVTVEKVSANDRAGPKKIQVIEPLCQPSRRKSHVAQTESKKTSKKENKERKHSESSKKSINKSQKDERKKKLKEIAVKLKEHEPDPSHNTASSKSVVNIKVTNTSRGEFLTNVVQAVKPTKRKEILDKTVQQKHKTSHGITLVNKTSDYKENHVEVVSAEPKSERKKRKRRRSRRKSDKTEKPHAHPIKAIRPLMDIDLGFFGKPVSKVEPLPPKKIKKSVRFSNTPPEVHVFQIEPGNKMKETRLVKTTLVDNHKLPIFSLEKITLMKILIWNPHWLDEQITNADPPPILGHNNIPLAKFQTYNNHHQYVQLIGDLLLMEIWECLTQGHLRTRNQPKLLQMRIENLPPVPPVERHFELFNLSVNISMPTTEAKNAPRVGEILIIDIGPPNSKISRFLFVHNVRILPAPPNNKNTFFSISLYAIFTGKMSQLKIGELIVGRSLAYINKELMLFEAMEYLSGSPLSEAILNPQPQHFQRYNNNACVNMNLPWTSTLNDSQKVAVESSVSAALGDRPNIQMVQGPPGTGKSSVICAMVMAYFYDVNRKKQQNRGKILICATSNAAIDEIVIRLLSIRQSLPKPERFKMVRVGRVEAMHSRAKDVSSQQLAARDAARLNAEPQNAVVAQQISHIEAKINMWKTAISEAKDPVRIAYCQGRITQLNERINMLRHGGGGGEDVRPERLMAAEKKIIDCADIIATTLASAQNNKMKGVKGRIALCIVDEAGQAIEPETLVPLTLDVTKLTLVGDPQQLPGYLCSQRAKKHGLGESLFARLTSCTELWPQSPVLLLNQQYRMHQSIADYPNRAFYADQIRTVPRPPVDLDIPPYTILGIHSGDKGQGLSGANDLEACGVSRLAAALAQITRPKGLSFAVITPYAAHRDLIRKYLKHEESDSLIEVNTVDSFQGQERDVVIVSLARSHGLGFLTDAGRMNVMLTRARHALVVCLNPHAVMRNDQWRTLIEDSQQRHLYKVLPNKMCRAPTRTESDEEILKYLRGK
ncbi:unnamed protein product [Pieris brassicae]|uniref:FHA domain-containing protein n=1 Tax=Pieris brassicae TaxID=7116 RepID=A0A9P0XFC1_PIEBR|nr:unnamed protein product [Pieris brassicae]